MTSSTPRKCGNMSSTKPLESSAVLAVHLLECALETRALLLVGDRLHRQRSTVCGDLERRVCIDVKQFEDRLVEDEGEAVAVAGEVLDHVRILRVVASGSTLVPHCSTSRS